MPKYGGWRFLANAQRTKSPVTENQTSDRMRNTLSPYLLSHSVSHVFKLTVCDKASKTDFVS